MRKYLLLRQLLSCHTLDPLGSPEHSAKYFLTLLQNFVYPSLLLSHLNQVGRQIRIELESVAFPQYELSWFPRVTGHCQESLQNARLASSGIMRIIELIAVMVSIWQFGSF